MSTQESNNEYTETLGFTYIRLEEEMELDLPDRITIQRTLQELIENKDEELEEEDIDFYCKQRLGLNPKRTKPFSFTKFRDLCMQVDLGQLMFCIDAQAQLKGNGATIHKINTRRQTLTLGADVYRMMSKERRTEKIWQKYPHEIDKLLEAAYDLVKKLKLDPFTR